VVESVCSAEFHYISRKPLLLERLIVASKENGLEVNVDKTKHIVKSRDQNAGRNHSIKIDNSSFESIEYFKNLETKLTYQHFIQ